MDPYSSLIEIITEFNCGNQVNRLLLIVRINVLVVGALSGSTVAGNTGDAGPYAYQLNSPTSVTFDPYGYLYVLDAGNSRIQKWLPRATYGVTVISSPMSTPYSMKIDPRGNLAVVDTSNHRALLFAMTCRKADFLSLMLINSFE